MKFRLSVFIILLIAGGEVFAQGGESDTLKHKKKIEYFFYLQSGTLIGCNECSLGKELTYSGATVHGVKIGNRLRVGAGIGYDSYYVGNSLPVFGSASWDLFSNKNAFFIQFNYGGALKFWKHSLYEEYGYQNSEGGRMVNPMVGYRIRYHDMSVSLMVGYKYQSTSFFYEYPTYYWDPARGQLMGDPMSTEINQQLNRLMISLAIGWR